MTYTSTSSAGEITIAIYSASVLLEDQGLPEEVFLKKKKIYIYICMSFASALRCLHLGTQHTGTKYKNNPYFKGTILLDRLPNNITTLQTVVEFKTHTKRLFVPFNEHLM